MIANIKGKGKQGTCEVCDKVTEVFSMYGGKMDMCAECKASEEEVVLQSKSAEKVIADMRGVDESLTLKQDLFNASTIPIVELKAVIWADESIPQEKKQYVYTTECTRHFEASQKRVFEKRQAVVEEENTQRAWQVAAQTAAGALTAAEREHFKKLNVSYQPATVKSVKPAKSKAPSKNYKGSEYRDAAAKYNVPVDAVRMIALQRNLNAEDAARIFSEITKSKQAVTN